MHVPLHYQVSEYDCVPTALINGVSYLFPREDIPPMVIHHIYLYCLDTVGRNSRIGIGGTSKYAVRLLGNWLSSYKMKRFSVRTQFLGREKITLEAGGGIQACLETGGVALCNVFLNPREEHYIMIMAIEDDWVYCFDTYRRIFIRGMQGKVKIIRSDDGRTPNLKIRRDWFSQAEKKRFCLGPKRTREALLLWNDY